MSAADVLIAFPNLDPSFLITSINTDAYNCIAWAANDDANFWWPLGGYWPADVVRTEEVASFETAFAAFGYLPTGPNWAYDPDVEKVAIYVNPGTGLVTHMARQLHGGRWTSKLGEAYDIEHQSPTCLNGDWYGVYSHCLGRPRQP